MRHALLVALFALLGCGRPKAAAYAQAFAEGERAETAGRFRDASERYDHAAAVAPNAREREHASYVAAKMLLQSGDAARAAPRLSAIAAATPPGEHAALAYFDLASYLIARGDATIGWAEMEAMPSRFPTSALARRALHRVLAHKDETLGAKASLAYLDGVRASLQTSDLEETAAYERAVRLEVMESHDAARAAFIALAEKWPCPFGALRDDALFHASEIDESSGRYAAAVADLEELLADREKASTMGTYQRPRYTPAQWRMAVLFRDRLGDRARAREAFHRLYSDFDTSLLRDDALWEEAALFRDDGNANAGCARLSTLTHEFPDSRYVPCAEETCPSIKRLEKSHAPKTCHAYLRKADAK